MFRSHWFNTFDPRKFSALTAIVLGASAIFCATLSILFSYFIDIYEDLSAAEQTRRFGWLSLVLIAPLLEQSILAFILTRGWAKRHLESKRWIVICPLVLVFAILHFVKFQSIPPTIALATAMFPMFWIWGYVALFGFFPTLLWSTYMHALYNAFCLAYDVYLRAQ